MSIISLIARKFSGDRRGAVRAANVAKRVDGLITDLEKQEANIEVLANRDKPNIKKVEKALDEHERLVRKISEGLRQIIEFEFASYQMDIKDPLNVVTSFIQAIKSKGKQLKDPELQEILRVMLRRIAKSVGDLYNDVRRNVSEVNEVFSREIVGAKSAYSISKGDLGRMALLIEARELQQRDFDKQIDSILREVNEGMKAIKKYLAEEQMGNTQLERALLRGIQNQWIRVGNDEFKQTKTGRWMVRDAGTSAMGVFAGKRELAESGILHYQLMQALKLFYDHFKTFIGYITQRAELAKEVIGHAGYMNHKAAHAVERIKADVQRYVGGNKELQLKLGLIEKRELEDARKAEKAAVAYGQHTLATARAAEGRMGKAIAAGVAAAIAGGILTGTAVQSNNAQGASQAGATGGKAAVIQQQIVIADVIEQQAKAQMKSSLQAEVHLPFGESDFAKALDLKEFEAKLIQWLATASQDAGYGADYKRLVKEQKIEIGVEGLSGYAGPVGNKSYNFKLSGRRVQEGENYLAELSSRIGVPVMIKSLEAKGETGEAEVLAVIEALFKKGQADPLIGEIERHLDLEGSRTLKYWWKWYKKYGKRKDNEKKKFALNNLLVAVHRIAAIDSLLLAPHRKVVYQFSLEYDKPTKGKQCVGKVIVVDPNPEIQALPAPAVFNEKAILASHERFFKRTAEPVSHPRFKDIPGYQKPNPKSRWVSRGPLS